MSDAIHGPYGGDEIEDGFARVRVFGKKVIQMIEPKEEKRKTDRGADPFRYDSPFSKKSK